METKWWVQPPSNITSLELGLPPALCNNLDLFDVLPHAVTALLSFCVGTQYGSPHADQVPKLRKEARFVKEITFNAPLARRVYNYPYFVRRRNELEGHGAIPVKED